VTSRVSGWSDARLVCVWVLPVALVLGERRAPHRWLRALVLPGFWWRVRTGRLRTTGSTRRSDFQTRLRDDCRAGPPRDPWRRSDGHAIPDSVGRPRPSL